MWFGRYTFFASLFSLISFAFPLESSSLYLTLQQSIQLALRNNETTLYNARQDYHLSEIAYSRTKSEFGIKSSLSLFSSRSQSSTYDLSNQRYLANLGLSKSLLIPTGGRVTLGLGLSSERSVSGDDITYTHTPELTLSLKQPLWKSGRFAEGSSRITADQNFLRAKLGYQLQRENLVLSVIQGYYGLLQAHRVVERAEQEVKSAQRVLEIGEARLRAGEISEFEVMNLKVQLATSEDHMLMAQNSAESQKVSFLRLLGLETREEVTLEKGIEIEPFELTLEECIEEAYQNRLDVQQADISVEAEEIKTHIAHSSNKPVLNLDGSYRRSSRDPSLTTSLKDLLGEDWRVSARLSFPLLDGGMSRYELESAKISYEKALKAKELLREEIALEIEGVYRELKLNERRIESLGMNLEIAEEALKIAELRFKMGLITAEDVSRTRDRLISAQSALDQAKISYILNKAEMAKARGKLEEEF
ncbi:MAG: TolC family protein [bacterium]